MTTLIAIYTQGEAHAEKFEYSASALLRRWGQKERAENLFWMVSSYLINGWRVVLVGHSNGCDIIARVLSMGARVGTVHLFAPAAFEADFEKAIAAGAVKRVHIYGSPNDGALLFASRTEKVLRWLHLGYGSMGLRGPAFAAKFPGVVLDHSIPGYDHDTWFLGGPYMTGTVRLVLTNDAKDQSDLGLVVPPS